MRWSPRPRLLIGVLGVLACGGMAAIGYFAYRTDVHTRQFVRILVHSAKSWWSPRSVLLLGDSRIEALHCDHALHGANVLNLGVAGLTATQLKANLERWLGRSRRFDRAAIWIGVNDILYHRRDPEQVAAEIGWIVTKLMERASRVAVIGQIPMLGDPNSNAVQATNKGLVRLQEALDLRLTTLNRAGKADRLVLLPMNREVDPRSVYSDAIHLNAERNGLICGMLSSWLTHRERGRESAFAAIERSHVIPSISAVHGGPSRAIVAKAVSTLGRLSKVEIKDRPSLRIRGLNARLAPTYRRPIRHPWHAPPPAGP